MGPRSTPSPGSSCTWVARHGQVVKLCNQVIYAAQMTATAEATAMAVQSGSTWRNSCSS